MDRKVTASNRFEKEPQFRYKMLAGIEPTEVELKEDYIKEP